MHFYTVATLISALAAVASAAPTIREAGPSGVLNQPAGGTVIRGSKLGSGGIWIDYKPVYEICGSTCDQTLAETFSIKATLVQGDKSYLLSNAEARNPQSGKINAFLGLPKGVCGDVQLVIDETQYYYGDVITFRSAAPSLSIDCNAQKP